MRKEFARLWSSLITVLLITSFFAFGVTETQAKTSKGKNHKVSRSKKKRRHYNPDKTKSEALLMIRANSNEISGLVGLEPIQKDNSLIANLDNQSEIDDEAASEAALKSSLLPATLSGNNTIEGDQGEDLEELAKSDDVVIDMSQFQSLWISAISSGDLTDETTESGLGKSEIMKTILEWLGTPYNFGGMSDKGIDCSAFTQKVYSNVAEVVLPRTAQFQFELGKRIKNKKDLKFGDLVFFHTRSYARASHVGIYLGDNLFAHASSRSGVTVSSLESTYYSTHFIGGRRFSSRDLENLATNSDKNNAH